MSSRHERVLIEANEVVARKLRDDPDGWYLVAVGGRGRARVLSQTAHRIRKGELEDFPVESAGKFTATSTSAADRPDKVADVELYAKYVPSTA
jgi:hypothetical protein